MKDWNVGQTKKSVQDVMVLHAYVICVHDYTVTQ